MHVQTIQATCQACTVTVDKRAHRAAHRRSRGKITILVALLVLCTGADAARIHKDRVLEPEDIEKLPALRAVTFMPQQGLAVLGRGFGGMSTLSAPGKVALSEPRGPSEGEVLAIGLGGMTGGMLVVANMERKARAFRLQAGSLLMILEDSGEWKALQADWQERIAETLLESGLVAGAPERVDPGNGEYDPRRAACERRQSCLIVATMWGFSDDGRRVEAQTRVRIWSPRLRGARQFTSVRSDFSNVLRYRSAPLPEIERDKNDDDRRWLQALADEQYAALNLGPLISQANALGDDGSRQARAAVVRYQRDHGYRTQRARKRKWGEDDLALVTARQWIEDGGVQLRAVLQEALAESVEMLRLELSADAQSTKNRGKFHSQAARATASVLRDGDREIVYLNDGTMLSRLKGDTSDIGEAWDAYFDEGSARAPASY